MQLPVDAFHILTVSSSLPEAIMFELVEEKHKGNNEYHLYFVFKVLKEGNSLKKLVAI